jgi:hypothetical protein
MAERRLVILKLVGKTPVLAMCERCQIKFFTPRELTNLPAEAEHNLWHKFNSHECKNEGRTPPRRVRKVQGRD